MELFFFFEKDENGTWAKLYGNVGEAFIGALSGNMFLLSHLHPPLTSPSTSMGMEPMIFLPSHLHPPLWEWNL